MQTIGIIGAGRMGMPIVGHLRRVGFDVLVCERDAARHAEIERRGGKPADLATLAASAQVVLVCVGYDDEVRELLNGAGGLLEHAQPRTIIAVLSTIQPKTMLEFSQQAAARGIDLVDSTICRGGRAADDGTLLSFVGGEATVVERLRPVLQAYSSDVVHTGPVGTAQVAKAANNLILWACLVANHEALALAQRHGIDVGELRTALLTSSATNGALENWGKQSMAWAEDDLDIVGVMARDVGLALPQTALVQQICRTLKPRRYELERYGI